MKIIEDFIQENSSPSTTYTKSTLASPAKIQMKGGEVKLRDIMGRKRLYKIFYDKKLKKSRDNEEPIDLTNLEGEESELKDFLFEEIPDLIDIMNMEYKGVPELSKDQMMSILDRFQLRIQGFIDNGLN